MADPHKAHHAEYDEVIAALHDDLTARLAANVRACRHNRRGLSQAELGERMGRSQAFINKVERGRFTPSVKRILALAHALDVDYGLLLAPDLPFGEPPPIREYRRRKPKPKG